MRALMRSVTQTSSTTTEADGSDRERKVLSKRPTGGLNRPAAFPVDHRRIEQPDRARRGQEPQEVPGAPQEPQEAQRASGATPPGGGDGLHRLRLAPR
jgi:hypothetical protein